MIRVIHISDLHFHAEDCRNERAKRLLSAIQGRYFKTDKAGEKNYLLVTGDLVDDAQGDQMAQAASALTPFAGKFLCAMGNHDCCVLGNFYEPNSVPLFRDIFAPLTVSHADPTDKVPDRDVLMDGDGTRVIMIGVNSVCPTLSPTDFANGEVGADQLQALRSLLAAPEIISTPTVVYLHHKALPMNFIEAPFMKIKDAKQFLSLMEGRVDVVAFGHSGDNEVTAYAQGALSLAARGETLYADANSSVCRQAYIEMVFQGADNPDVSIRRL